MQTRFPTRPSYLLSAITLATAILISGCSPSQGGQQQGPGGAHLPVVEVLSVKTQEVVLTSELAGRTAPYLIAEVRPQVSGVIQARNFTEGGEVQAGQALYQIEAARYESALDSAKAALAKAEANLTSTRLRASRYEELADIEAVSKQARDDAQASLKQAQADVLSASAQVRAAQIDLAYTRVNAPISGRIGRSSVTPGALVTANQSTTLVTVQQLDPIYVDVTQSSTELMRLQKDLAEGRVKSQGQGNVKLLLEDGSSYAYAGKLQFSEVSVDPATGTVTLRAVFPNPKRELLPGMYVRAVIEKGVSQQSVVVPQKAVSRDAKGQASVMTVRTDGKVQPRPVTIGQSLGNNWLVTSGLQGGESVIVEGLQSVRPGMAVQATAWQADAVQKTAQATR